MVGRRTCSSSSFQDVFRCAASWEAEARLASSDGPPTSRSAPPAFSIIVECGAAHAPGLVESPLAEWPLFGAEAAACLRRTWAPFFAGRVTSTAHEDRQGCLASGSLFVLAFHCLLVDLL